MNIRKVVMEIHAKAARESAGVSGIAAASGGSPAVANELTILHSSYERLYQMRGLIGQMPPSPDTFRARAGAHLIRAIQRMLFWYTPQIHRVQHEVTNTIGSLCRLIEIQMDTIGALAREVRAIQCSQVAPPSHTSQAAGNTVSRAIVSGEAAPIPAAFEFALQDRFRGSEGDTRAKLEEWLRMILESGGNSGGGWLDIGCGRGEWLALVSEGGHAVSGIDANPAAVDYCRSRDFRAVQADALDYLRATPDGSLGVVTMFHVVEHLPSEYLLQLLPLIFQKLRAGGLIAIETPNPGNLLMGSHYFWNDPTHRRPLPEALLTFMLEYAGFAVIRRVGLNHFPPENHLPWREIDVVRQVDSLLFDARDYGVLGRK
ncbi:MAG: class I SAM-dependent methyltransferase [Bryobacteraceae bacterium]|jgi:SAM-dependent methyltransferase